MARLSYHVCRDVEQHEPGLHDGTAVDPDLPAVFEIPARCLTYLDRPGQDRRQGRDRAHQPSSEQRIAESILQVEHQVAQAGVTSFVHQLERQAERIHPRPGALRRRFDALRNWPAQALAPVCLPRKLSAKEQEAELQGHAAGTRERQ